MASSQLDLIELLRAIDPEAPLAERHLWLMQLLDWVRARKDAQLTPDGCVLLPAVPGDLAPLRQAQEILAAWAAL